MIQRSRLVHIDAGAIPPVSLREDENGKPTQAIEDLATGSVELTSKLWEFYRDSHDWDVPRRGRVRDRKPVFPLG